ncbi:hypothetical protein QRD43_06100 [Pelomonas sp. APW6]|uniref:Lipoprotein n=1 Tax=Roseateles subflavus TaxID=3053353 RepID=A0ABT7LF50_9BURK|nr:hypothetical protein [Pelomonas sp. APW6]MDL5031475.1 hypothetical protein [Pelomonas sp. APW6]
MGAAGDKARDGTADRTSRPRGDRAQGPAPRGLVSRCRALAGRQAAARSVCAAVLVVLSACAGIGPGGSGGPGKPVQGPDSLAMECPSEFRYELPVPLGAPLAALRDHAEQRLQALGLRANWDGPWAHAQAQRFGGEPAELARLRRLLAVVLPALERYHPSFFQRTGLQEVGLVKDLVVGETQMRLAMPAPERHAVVYADNANPLCAAGMELRVHHELYHLVELRLFGDFYYRDPAWLALNPEGLAYGQGGATAYGGTFHNLGHPAAGLVSRYALYGPEEDKAEVFGWLMTPGYAGRVKAWSEQDLALAAKRRFMMALVHRLSAGTMSESFFEALAREQPAPPVSPAGAAPAARVDKSAG